MKDNEYVQIILLLGAGLWLGLILGHASSQAGVAAETPSSKNACSNVPSAAIEQFVLEVPQFNYLIPLVFGESLLEADLQENLQFGAVVLPLGTAFGEEGNVVITAHSAGSPELGLWRDAFSGLGQLKEGDEFKIITPAAAYQYRVYDTEIVWPQQVDRLPQGNKSTVTLVTCWPLWTRLQRMLVHAELTNIEHKW